MLLTLQQAANATGKAKSTIQRAIKSGKLSATLSSDGNYLIDTSELSRVYVLHNATPKMQQVEQHATANATELLRLKLEFTEKLLQHANDTVADLRQRLDNSETERRALQLRLEHKPAPEPPEPGQPEHSALYRRLFMRGK